MRAKIATLTGEIAPDQLGKIYIHEHVLTDPPPSRMRLDPDYKLDSIEKIVAELNLFYAAGGRSLMDCTALDYGRDAKRMLEVARQVKVNILALTGFNRGDYVDWVRNGDEGLFEELIMKDIEEGMDGTACKPAVIKIGTGYNNILPSELKTIKAAGRAHQQSGLPVLTHTTLGTMGFDQVRLLEQAGVNPNRVALSHLDQNLDFYYLNQIASTGAYIEFDGPSKVKYAPDSARVEMLARLCDAGHEERILISGDMVFINSVGRPDLGGQAEAWAGMLFDSIQKIKQLDQQLLVLPGHFADWSEANDKLLFAQPLGEVFKRNQNIYNMASKDEFTAFIKANMRPQPEEYATIRQVNANLIQEDDEKQEVLDLGKNECAATAYAAQQQGQGMQA